MAKVNFNKLTLGHPLTREAVWGNLDQCASALSGNISADQRAENRSIFTFALQKVRCGTDALTEGLSPPEGFTWAPALPMNETGSKTLNFFLPPFQEFFDDSLVGDINTPGIILESISLSFDGANQQYPIRLSTGMPDESLVFDQDFEVQIKSGNSVGQVTIPKTTLNISNDEIINRPNPTVSANIGAVIDPYSKLELSVRVPISTQSDNYAGIPFLQDFGIDNMLIRASFSAPIVQRDTLAHTVYPQNVPPLAGLGRSTSTCQLQTPVAGSVIKAGDRESADVDGLQDALEQLDREVREKLKGGLTRSSELRLYSESLLEDQGYFCISVPLFNAAEVNMIDSLAPNAPLLPPHYRDLQGYLRPSTKGGVPVTALMDRAVIPIVAPGTIHHIGVFFDKFATTSSTDEYHMDFGVALGCCPGSSSASYTQVSYVGSKNVTFSSATQNIQHFFSPLAYSTAAGAPALGSGYVTQGRPFFFGQQVDQTGGVLRGDVASAFVSASAEGPPQTNGAEQFIEIRANIHRKDTTGVPAYVDLQQTGISTSTAQLAGWSGVVVCLYGKMALVE